jgi:amino acid transporter
VIIQPIAPMGIYGVINNEARGHVVTTILIAMVAMLFTAISYGKMARAYPSAGSAYTYVGKEIHPALGYVTGWAMVMDYILNPLICTVICSELARNILPGLPYWALAIAFAGMFTALNLRAIKTSARINEVLAAGMTIVVVIFFGFVIRSLWGWHQHGAAFFTQPFYDPATFDFHRVFRGTSIAVLTYIGFDAISTFSEEAENPRRDILLATVLVCVITGILSSLEVYAAQLVWGGKPFPQDMLESAFPLVARQVGGFFLFHLLNFTILIANVGSGMGAQLAGARLLYGMGRSNRAQAPESDEQCPADRSHRAHGSILHQLRAGSGAAQFRRVHCVHGSERGGLRAVLLARAREALDELGFPTPRIRDLFFHLAQPEPARKDRRRRLDSGWNRLRRGEDTRFSGQPGAIRHAG